MSTVLLVALALLPLAVVVAGIASACEARADRADTARHLAANLATAPKEARP